MSKPTTLEAAVLSDLATMTYDQIHIERGISRGKIYSIAMKFGARKNEARIRERAADRKKRQRETLEAIINTTATADVLDYLEGLPDGCAQLVITSPPYNVGKGYGGGVGADTMAHVMYAGWLAMIISEMSRVLAPGGMMLLQVGATRDETDRIVPIDMLVHETIRKTGLMFQNRIVWTVPHGLTPKRRLSGRHETVLCYSKGEPATFNPTPGRTPQKEPGKRAFKGPNRGKLSGHPLGAWPSDVWAIPNIGANNGEKTGHPAQMPEELARRAIQIYTNVGDLVVDPFSGAGTTHKVCMESGRRFTGADLFYEDLRTVRLAKAGLATICPLPGVSDESVAVWQAEAVRVDYDPGEQLSLLDAA